MTTPTLNGGHAEQAQQLVRLGELVKRVHIERLNAHSIAERVRCAREVFEASIAELVELAKQAQEAAAGAEAELRALAMAYHAAHPEQKTIVANAVSVKDFTVVDYDSGEAFDWAMEHARIYLQLNATKFEKLAKASPELVPFVAVKTEPRVQLATDMERALRALETAEVLS